MLLIQGGALAAAAVLAMAVGVYGLNLDHTSVQTVAMTTLAFSQMLHTLNVRVAPNASGSLRRHRAGPLMIGAIVGSSLL